MYEKYGERFKDMDMDDIIDSNEEYLALEEEKLRLERERLEKMKQDLEDEKKRFMTREDNGEDNQHNQNLVESTNTVNINEKNIDNNNTDEIEKKRPIWSPPRKKIVIRPIEKKGTLSEQNTLCFGCGTPLSQGWFTSVRFCRYIGKYFCNSCHKNNKFLNPGRILFYWDFSYVYISEFYKQILEEIYNDPIFDIKEINKELLNKVPILKKIQNIRMQLHYMKKFISTCKYKNQLMNENIIKRRNHLFDTQLFSLSDFVEIYKEKLFPFLTKLYEIWIKHISQCEICKSKGSKCEYCNSEELIYPFHIKTAIQCKTCEATFHRACYDQKSCPNCLRNEINETLMVSSIKRQYVNLE